jgi:hypothetical protein
MKPDFTQCPYCGRSAELVTGAVIYPRRPDLHPRKFWHCAPCRAYVGTHVNSATHEPLGRLANATLRAAKSNAHRFFDPLWQRGGMTRRQAYAWLAGRLGIPVAACHIGWFDVNMCHRVIRLSKQKQKDDYHL